MLFTKHSQSARKWPIQSRNVTDMSITIEIVIIWVLAGLVVLSGYVPPAGWLVLAVAGLHIAYGSYLMSAS